MRRDRRNRRDDGSDSVAGPVGPIPTARPATERASGAFAERASVPDSGATGVEFERRRANHGRVSVAVGRTGRAENGSNRPSTAGLGARTVPRITRRRSIRDCGAPRTTESAPDTGRRRPPSQWRTPRRWPRRETGRKPRRIPETRCVRSSSGSPLAPWRWSVSDRAGGYTLVLLHVCDGVTRFRFSRGLHLYG